MTRGRRRLALALLWLAAACGVGAALAGAAAWCTAEVERRRQAGASAVDVAFRRQAAELEALADRLSEAWMDAAVASAAAEDGATPWQRLQAVLGSSGAPPGATVAVYEELEGGDVRPGMVLLGAADGKIVEAPATLALTHELPAGLIYDEFDVFNGDGSLRLLIWFTPGTGTATRLNLLAHYLHERVDEPEDDESTDVLRLFHVSTDFLRPPNVAVALRLDMVAGSLQSELPSRSLPAPAHDWSPEAPALHPNAFPRLRFPHDDSRPRAAVHSMAPPLPVGLTLLGAVALVALLGAGALQVLARRRAAAAPPDVAAEAAHEMRTPLTVMRGELEVALRRERPPEEYREALTACLDEVKGLQRLQDAVLLLSRAATTAHAEESVDMAAVAAAEVERVGESHPDRDVTYEGPDDPLLVEGDPSLLARAIGNLLDNAARHSVAGGAIRTTVRSVGAAVEVSVEDAGPGIPPARMERVFERFYRGPEVGQRGIPGSGLGLPIVRWIAQVHGGSIHPDATVQGRARLVLRIPRRA